MEARLTDADIRQQMKKALLDEDSFATTLRLVLEEIYGPDVFGNPETGSPPYDPLLIWRSVYDDLGISIPEEGENRINALITAMSTSGFYTDTEAFSAVCNALYAGDLGDVVSAGLDDLTVPEVLWGMFEVELNRGKADLDFSPGVTQLIQKTAADENADPDAGGGFYVDGFMKDATSDLILQLDATGLEWRRLEHLKNLL
jgi:hypothetical protein